MQPSRLSQHKKTPTPLPDIETLQALGELMIQPGGFDYSPMEGYSAKFVAGGIEVGDRWPICLTFVRPADVSVRHAACVVIESHKISGRSCPSDWNRSGHICGFILLCTQKCRTKATRGGKSSHVHSIIGPAAWAWEISVLGI
jgi:hypothetical protein